MGKQTVGDVFIVFKFTVWWSVLYCTGARRLEDQKVCFVSYAIVLYFIILCIFMFGEHNLI